MDQSSARRSSFNGQARTEGRRERIETDRAFRLYREPLVSSAYDLQSRLYNILRLDFLAYLRAPEHERRNIAMETTLFAFAQYFGWREILRREIQLLAFETQDVGRILSAITGTLGTDALGDAFLLWKAEQRAIGEAMISEWRGNPSCAGYLEFCELRQAELGPRLAKLEHDLTGLAHKQVDDQRVREVQHLLVKLIENLDPDHIRYAPERLQLA